MDFSINAKQRKLVRLVKEIAEAELKPCLLSPQQGDDFDWGPLKALAAHNLVCPTVPEEYGGRGLDRLTTALLMEEIAAGHPGAAAVIAATLHAVEPILLAGSAEQKARFLPGLTGKEAGVAAFALTETVGGSDLSGMRTCAVQQRQDFYLHGSKNYVINAPAANWIAVIAATGGEHKKASLRVFLVERDSKGLGVGSRIETSGLNYAGISAVNFENVPVPADCVIKGDEAGSGYLLLTQTFDRGRAMVGAISVGIARAALENALEFAENRVQFGTVIKNHQAVAFALADMATRVEAARLITHKACWLIDRGDDYSAASAMAKVAGSETAQRVTAAAADILGARGYQKGSLIEQLVRDARVLSTIEGTNNMQRIVIASQL